MRTEEEIRNYIEKLKKDNPRSFLNRADDGTRGWYQGMIEMAKFVLSEDNK